MGYSASDIITILFRVVRNYAGMNEYLKLEYIKVGAGPGWPAGRLLWDCPTAAPPCCGIDAAVLLFLGLVWAFVCGSVWWPCAGLAGHQGMCPPQACVSTKKE